MAEAGEASTTRKRVDENWTWTGDKAASSTGHEERYDDASREAKVRKLVTEAGEMPADQVEKLVAGGMRRAEAKKLVAETGGASTKPVGHPPRAPRTKKDAKASGLAELQQPSASPDVAEKLEEDVSDNNLSGSEFGETTSTGGKSTTMPDLGIMSTTTQVYKCH